MKLFSIIKLLLKLIIILIYMEEVPGFERITQINKSTWATTGKRNMVHRQHDKIFLRINEYGSLRMVELGTFEEIARRAMGTNEIRDKTRRLYGNFDDPEIINNLFTQEEVPGFERITYAWNFIMMSTSTRNISNDDVIYLRINENGSPRMVELGTRRECLRFNPSGNKIRNKNGRLYGTFHDDELRNNLFIRRDNPLPLPPARQELPSLQSLSTYQLPAADIPIASGAGVLLMGSSNNRSLEQLQRPFKGGKRKSRKCRSSKRRSSKRRTYKYFCKKLN